MFVRLAVVTSAAVVLSSAMPEVGSAEEDQSAVEAPSVAANELIVRTRVLWDCEVLVESIERPRIQATQTEVYFVWLTAEGPECEQAIYALNDLGRDKGLYFALPREAEPDAETPAGTNGGLTIGVAPDVED